MKHPTATRKDHEKFCTTEGWTNRKISTGKTGTHHHNYEFPLPDGRILMTRISHPVNRTDYGPAIWKHILRDQLDVAANEFWNCVKNGVKPDRGTPPQAPPEAIPIEVVTALIYKFRIPEHEVRAMTKQQAIDRMLQSYADEQQHGNR